MYAIRLNWIDDDGFYRSKIMNYYKNIDDASKDFPAYIRLSGQGWYDIVEVSSDGIKSVTL